MKAKWKKTLALLLTCLLFFPPGLTKPVMAETSFQPVVIANYNFDVPAKEGWMSRGSANLTVTNEVYQSAGYSLKVTDRTSDWHGAANNVTDLIQANTDYEVKGYARLVSGEDPADIKFTMEVANGNDNNTYLQVATAPQISEGVTLKVTDEGWVELKSSVPFSISAFTTLTLYAESSVSDLEFYLDDITITQLTEAPEEEHAPEPELLEFYDFEDGELSGWVRRNGDDGIQVTNEDNYTSAGQYSIKTTVSQQYDGALKSVVGLFNRNDEYKLSARVKMAEGEPTTSFRISVQYSSGGFANVSQNANVTDGEWVLLEGNYIQSSTPGDILNVYVEMANGSGDARTFLVDDFKIEYVQTLPGPDPDYTLTALKEAYEEYFPIGNIMNSGDFEDEDRLAFLKHHSELLSAENAMKPEYAYDREDPLAFNFVEMDKLVNNALTNDFDVHGHVLVWHSQSPSWQHTDPETNEPLEKEEALDNLRTHVRTVVEHYEDKVISWDVVNEAIEDSLLQTPDDWRSALRRSGWWHATQEDFIYEAFLEARKVINENEWDIDLYYNDYNEDNPAKATAIAAMITELNQKYQDENDTDQLLIDGMGMQSHHHVSRTKPENVKAAMDKYIAAGVKLGVTELDIMAGEGGIQSEEQAQAQAYLYAQLFQLYKEYAEHITRVTFWGIDDQTSWRAENSPLIFNGRLQAKPSYFAVIDPETFIANYVPPVLPENRSSDAIYGKPKLDGEIDSAWDNAPRLELDRYQQAHNGAKGYAKVLWDDENLYVLVESNDTDLDDSSNNAHEEDSAEIFIDENNAKATSYDLDDGQYRVNYNNIASFNPSGASEGFESAVNVGSNSYVVEMKIPFKTITPENGTIIGFDAQINDATEGSRRSVAIWNDFSGAGWQNPSVFGQLTLKGKSVLPSPTPRPTSPDLTPSPTIAPIPTPLVTVTDGKANVEVSDTMVKDTLALGQKQVVIEVKDITVKSSTIQLPKSSLNSTEPYSILIKTPQGQIEVPSNMLSSMPGISSENITIMISSFDKEELDDTARELVGNRPVIKLNVLVDGNVVNWSNSAAPVKVFIPYTPTADELANPESIVIWYIDSQGNVTVVPNSRYDATTGLVQFTTTHFSTFAVGYSVKSFNDISNVPWAVKSIETMASRNIINGVSKDAYSPSENIKRADFITLLVRALELQSSNTSDTMFSDVKPTDYFYNEVRIAKQLGIASGVGNDKFDPDASITRQDAMVFAIKAMEAAGMNINGSNLNAYSDGNQVAEYAQKGVSALANAGIINGFNGKISPNELLTRAQAAVILYRIWSY